MRGGNTRRTFLQHGAAAGAIVGLGDLGFSRQARARSARPKRGSTPTSLRLHPEVEPIVRLLEETPRDKLLEEVAARIRGGLSYRELLAGLLWPA